ncbi:hypothetical protein DP806_16525 [Salmonella enterica subsp. enterica serovar Saintpaul]|nr:hypothetical protein [Salmonella enterica subsp. enterica serovar Saintpaul]
MEDLFLWRLRRKNQAGKQLSCGPCGPKWAMPVCISNEEVSAVAELKENAGISRLTGLPQRQAVLAGQSGVPGTGTASAALNYAGSLKARRCADIKKANIICWLSSLLAQQCTKFTIVKDSTSKLLVQQLTMKLAVHISKLLVQQ